MYKKRFKQAFRTGWRYVLLLISIGALSLGAVGGTLAYLHTNTKSVENSFAYGDVSCDITEQFDGTVKEAVCVRNTSNTDAYIRAAIVITWQLENGTVSAKNPLPVADYTLLLGDDWIVAKDGYYYYPNAISPSHSTSPLITRCSPSGSHPEGYSLSVEVVAEAIQSLPAAAAETAWGLQVIPDGSLSPERME